MSRIQPGAVGKDKEIGSGIVWVTRTYQGCSWRFGAHTQGNSGPSHSNSIVGRPQPSSWLLLTIGLLHWGHPTGSCWVVWRSWPLPHQRLKLARRNGLWLLKSYWALQTQLLKFHFRSLNMHLGINSNFFTKKITENFQLFWGLVARRNNSCGCGHQLWTMASQGYVVWKFPPL